MSTAKRGWKNPYPVMVVSGGAEYLRWREIQKATKSALASGRQVVSIPSGDSESLRQTLEGGFLFEGTTLAIVESSSLRKKKKAESEDSGSWTESDLEAVLAHSESEDSDLCLLIHHAGDAGTTSFATKVSASLPKGRHLDFPAPKPWEASEVAEKFFKQELLKRDKKIEDGLVSAVVRQAGTDLGVLSFDALKVSMLLDSEGRDTVLRTDLVGMVTSFGAEDWQHLQTALAARSPKSIIKVLGDLRATSGGDNLIQVCVIVGNTLLRWLHTAELLHLGVGAEEAATRIGVHPYRHQKENIPPATAWGRSNLLQALQNVTSVERGAKSGHPSPWIALETALVLACQAAR